MVLNNVSWEDVFSVGDGGALSAWDQVHNRGKHERAV